MTRIVINTTTNGRAQLPMSVRALLNIVSGDQLIVEIIDVIHVGKDGVSALAQGTKSTVKPNAIHK